METSAQEPAAGHGRATPRQGKETSLSKDKIPHGQSYEEIADFWDNHSLADYWDQTEAFATG